MKRGGYGFIFMLLAVALALFVPGLAVGDYAENMRFDPLPQPGDTSVSGTCDQTEGCDGYIDIALAIGGLPPQDVQVIGLGFCEGGRFTINLCSNIVDGSAPTVFCDPYVLQRGDIISAGQYLGDFAGQEPLQPEDMCDATPWFTVGLGIPAVTQWGVVILSVLLALSAIVLIRRRRVRQED